jgi:hypothetical protein
VIFQIKTETDIPTLVVTEGTVTCVLVLDPKCHEIKTKCEDTIGLAERIAYSYRICFGNGNVGVKFLKAIKKDLIERESKHENKNEN